MEKFEWEPQEKGKWKTNMGEANTGVSVGHDNHEIPTTILLEMKSSVNQTCKQPRGYKGVTFMGG